MDQIEIKKMPKQYKEDTPDKVIAGVLAFLMLVILIASLLTVVSPNWYRTLSERDRHFEMGYIVSSGVIESMNGHQYHAMEYYQKALKVLPTMPEAWVDIGIAYKKLGKNDSAMAALNYALTLNTKDSTNIYSNISDIYTVENNPELSLEYFNKAEACNSFLIDKYMQTGIYAMNNSNWEEAAKYYRLALEARQDLVNYYIYMLHLNYVFHTITPTQEKEFKPILDAGVKQIDLNVYDKELFLKVLNRDRAYAENFNKLGYVLAKMDSLVEAKQYFLKALNIDPFYEDANINFKYVSDILHGLKSPQNPSIIK